jgi:hypothetical protein
VTPVVRGRPVALVSTTAEGVPNAGVTKVGEVDKTRFPLPVEDVTPVPPFATGKVPVTPVERGRPVVLVSTPEAGVPNAGVTKVGEVDKTTFPVPVEEVTPVPPFATGRAVPDRLIAKVPDVVIGDPLIDKKLGTLAATEVTVPPV